MDHFERRAGALCCEDVPLGRIVEAVGAPVYVYSTATLERHFRVFGEALRAHPALGRPLIAYAVKANSNQSVIATLARLGAGADTVSGGEIARALAAGVPAQKIVFSGVGKTQAEIAQALLAGILQINVESEPELETVAAIAAERRESARVAIRVNPDIVAGGHAKVETGAAASKFGVALADAERLYALAARHPWLEPAGLACHIGSQITGLAPLEKAFRRLRQLGDGLAAAGLAVPRYDLGGGLGAPYFQQPDPPGPSALADLAARVFAGAQADFIFEPGRVIAANAGALVSRVILIHQRPDGRRIAVLDAGMNDLVRPALYDAYHDIRPVITRAGAPSPYDVVGPVCESGDTFARERPLPPLAAGDLVAFMTAGAYGAVMASEYNSRPLVPEVLVRGASFAVVRPRGAVEEMIAREPLAPWLGGG
ncbi:MAG TPA: diaminopimelate decarboxylase [Caulobacteraceae bacterium]|nr:diaminopimelate decarboxylase [Caulobacteraceae bacterium]